VSSLASSLVSMQVKSIHYKSVALSVQVIHVKVTGNMIKNSHKSFLKENKHMTTEPSKKIKKKERNDTTTLSYHPYILYHFANYTLCCYLCGVCRRVAVHV